MENRVPGAVRFLLLFSAVGLVPIALSYGAMPAVSLGALYDINVDNVNLAHIMRAVMGLYLAMALIWVLGAFKPSLSAAALLCCAVFMIGLASGRILSLLLDGWPHWLLVLFIGLEAVIGTLAIILYKKVQTP